MIAIIHHVDIAFAIASERPRRIEASRLRTGLGLTRQINLAPNIHKLQRSEIKYLNAMVRAICDEERAPMFRYQESAWRVKLGRPPIFASDTRQGRHCLITPINFQQSMPY
jgi:hypothetical protein